MLFHGGLHTHVFGALIAPVIRDVFRCYRWLYEEAKVIHRDISLNNLMYRKKADNSVYGVLSDYDLSHLLTRQTPGPTSKQRTGTKPYMAIDLLQPSPPNHLYHHDLESLFYVIVILTSRYHKGQKINENPPHQAWFDLRAEALPTSDFQHIMIWTSQMSWMFQDGFQARRRHEDNINLAKIWPSNENKDILIFDELTLGGHVDFDKFARILAEPG
ncbi:hypothetical protein BYT27DRAFT_7341453 [Phlegmacium glaucopus]|nr:hypothetical protein BYT27DRAFT_7341453 [Phlegmacium glaucopus]